MLDDIDKVEQSAFSAYQNPGVAEKNERAVTMLMMPSKYKLNERVPITRDDKDAFRRENRFFGVDRS